MRKCHPTLLRMWNIITLMGFSYTVKTLLPMKTFSPSVLAYFVVRWSGGFLLIVFLSKDCYCDCYSCIFRERVHNTKCLPPWRTVDHLSLAERWARSDKLYSTLLYSWNLKQGKCLVRKFISFGFSFLIVSAEYMAGCMNNIATGTVVYSNVTNSRALRSLRENTKILIFIFIII